MKKLTKFGRSTLSVILCLTMLLTTFCFFDIGSVISNAMVTVTENNKMKGSLSSQFMYAPEIAYLKPGSSAFQYFSNYDPATGKAISTNDATSRLEFDYKGATEVAVAVNKVYYKGANADAIFAGELKINGNSVTQANVDFDGSNCPTNFSTIALAKGNSTVNYSIAASSSSLAGTTTGTTYYIQWVFRYKVDGAYHFAFMYTGVYVPILEQAGIASHQRYKATGSNPTENHGWSFITGAMKYSGGNRRSQFMGTAANTIRTAPLITFKGTANEKREPNTGSNATIPGGSNEILSEDNFTPDVSPYNTFVWKRDRYLKSTHDASNNIFYQTSFSHIPKNFDDVVKGSTTLTDDNTIDSAHTTGMAYIVVDTSRYKNYNQIPYLSAGFAQFYHDNDGNGNKLNSIKSVGYYEDNSTTEQSYAGKITCDVDSANWKDGDSSSVARGLYKFNGDIVDGLVTIDTWFYNGWKHFSGVGKESLGVHHINGLYTETVDKQTLRTVYNDASHSHIDYKTYSSGYSAYYTELKSVAETLCNPQLYSKKTTSLSGTALGSVKAIETSIVNSTTTADNYVYFYAPEAIYLTPSTAASSSSGTYSAQYVLNQNVTISGETCTQSVKQGYDTIATGGTVYFYYKNASKVKITCSADNGVTFTPSLSSSYNVKASNTYYNCSDGTLMKLNFTTNTKTNYYKSCYVTWTATYVEDNIEKTVTAKTYVYAPFVKAVAAISGLTCEDGRVTGHRYISAGLSTAIFGVQQITSSQSNNVYLGDTNFTNDGLDQTGVYKYYLTNHTTTPAFYGGQANPTTSNLMASIDTDATASSLSGTGSFYRGGKNSGNAKIIGGTGKVYFDPSRVSKIGNIPNFYAYTYLNGTSSASNNWSDFDKFNYYAKYAYGSTDKVTQSNGLTVTEYKKNESNGSNYKDMKSVMTFTPVISNVPISNGTTFVSSLELYMQKGSGHTRTGLTIAKVDFIGSDRSGLRKAVEYAAKYSYALQAEYFNGSTQWTNYTTALANAQNALTKVDGTADFGTYNVDSKKRSGLAKTLMDAVDVLLNANRGTAPRNTNNYTATQKNVGLVANSNGTFTVAAIAEAASDGTASISSPFKAYDKVEFFAEQYGHNAFAWIIGAWFFDVLTVILMIAFVVEYTTSILENMACIDGHDKSFYIDAVKRVAQVAVDRLMNKQK